MKITLRKASAIQNSINELLNSIQVAHVVELSEFEDLDEGLVKAREKFDCNLQRRSDLIDVLYKIRHLVAEAKAASGVDSVLTEAAHINKHIEELTRFSLAGPTPSMAVIEGRAERIRNSDKNSYLSEDGISVNVLSVESIGDIHNKLTNLKKKKQELADQLLELNIRSEVTLDQTTVDQLKAENLV